jgi:hypothetical protein
MGMAIEETDGQWLVEIGRAMSDIGAWGQQPDHYKKQRVAALAAFSLASAIVLCTSESTRAQINIGSGEPPTLGNTVCSGGGTLFVKVNGDCGDIGANVAATGNLTVGPAGSETILDGTVGGATFHGVTSFHNATVFTAPMAASAASFSGHVGFTSSVSIASNTTVDMGGNRVQNVGTPTTGTDATNKDYVDGLHNQQQTQIDDIVVVNNQQQTQINQHGVRLTNVETVNTQQDTRLTGVETVNTQQNTRLTALESGIAGQAEQISAINQSLKRLSRRDGELADGIAISLALAQPAFQPGQSFAIRGGWGNFDGSNALGVSAAGLLYSFRNGGSVILDVGVGASMRYNMFAGRGGVTLGW